MHCLVNLDYIEYNVDKESELREKARDQDKNKNVIRWKRP